jgi:hypothetical protein
MIFKTLRNRRWRFPMRLLITWQPSQQRTTQVKITDSGSRSPRARQV